jgi:uncharacterized integral membrane protein
MNNQNKLPLNIRIALGVFAAPSLVLAYMIIVMAMNGQHQQVDYFEWVYSLIGIVSMYVAITGKRLL